MDHLELETFVHQVVEDVEHILGAQANSALLEHFARDAVLDLWLTRTGITVSFAREALVLVRNETARRQAANHEVRDGARDPQGVLVDTHIRTARPAGTRWMRPVVWEEVGCPAG
jgi:hypothetical protein